MKTLVLFIFTILLHTSWGVLGQGSLTYSNVRMSREAFVFQPHPDAPDKQIVSSSVSDFAGSQIVTGDGFYAELWWAPRAVAEETDLSPHELTKVTFRADGRINGRAKLDFPDTYGGDFITMQLRVWDNRGGTVESWAEALADPGIPRGKSNLITSWELSGVDALGQPHLGNGSLGYGLKMFNLFLIPEPNCATLLWMGLASMGLLGAMGSRSSKGCRTMSSAGNVGNVRGRTSRQL
ncbi:MAG: hypothetical protein JNN07_09935 [Verrucomicrobiales bacterium]|nr:hypothetical protein [Verrucomicrobiales bacterium]